MIRYFLSLMLIMAVSCSVKSDRSKVSKVETIRPTIAHVIDFLAPDLVDSTSDILLFFTKDDPFPVSWNSIGEEELSRSILFYEENFSFLILDNPSQSAVYSFYKDNQSQRIFLLPRKHFPDSIEIKRFSDTLIVCSYYWDYDFGSDFSDLKVYLFFGEKSGLFSFCYSSTGEENGLNLNDFSSQKENIVLPELSGQSMILVSPDTLIRLESKENRFIHRIDTTFYYDKVFVMNLRDFPRFKNWDELIKFIEFSKRSGER